MSESLFATVFPMLLRSSMAVLVLSAKLLSSFSVGCANAAADTPSASAMEVASRVLLTGMVSGLLAVLHRVLMVLLVVFFIVLFLSWFVVDLHRQGLPVGQVHVRTFMSG